MNGRRAVLFVGSACAVTACLYSVGNVQTEVDGNVIPLDADGASAADATEGGVDESAACAPKSCPDLAICGSADDGCGTKITCTCEPGRTCSDTGRCCGAIFPGVAYEASPFAGNACNVNNVRATDGVVAGLAYTTYPNIGKWGTLKVTGCVGVDFGSVRALNPLVVRAAGSKSACGTTCVEPDCSVTHGLRIYYGRQQGAYAHVDKDTAVLTATLTDYAFQIPEDARYVVVCRGGEGPAGPNVVVDSIRIGDPCE